MPKSIVISNPSLIARLLGGRLPVADFLLSLSPVFLSSRARQAFFADLLGRRVSAVDHDGPAFCVSVPRFCVQTYLIKFK